MKKIVIKKCGDCPYYDEVMGCDAFILDIDNKEIIHEECELEDVEEID